MSPNQIRAKLLFGAALAALAAFMCFAQFRSRGRFPYFRGESEAGPWIRTEGGQLVNEDTVRTARETAPHSVTWPDWTNPAGFGGDAFTFARILFKSSPGRPKWLGWVNDYPDADLNLSYRLQQLTSMKVDPNGRVLRLTDVTLAEYPFIFMSHPEGMILTEAEERALRSYLMNGGALMADDFWGSRDWDAFEDEMKRVLPGRTWTELGPTNRVFHSVFDLRPPMNRLQVPSLQLWAREYDPDNPQATTSYYRGPGSEQMHVRAWLDDRNRIMVVATHNTDTGDGWEREGENEVYFETFSEPRAYPLAINIIFCLMTQ